MVKEDANVQIVLRLIATSTHVASCFGLASHACIGCSSVGPLMWQVGLKKRCSCESGSLQCKQLPGRVGITLLLSFHRNDLIGVCSSSNCHLIQSFHQETPACSETFFCPLVSRISALVCIFH